MTIPPRGCILKKNINKIKLKSDTKNLVRRLKIIEGQVRGLIQMIENETYCIDVITQGSAIKQALSNVEDLLLEKHLAHCVVNQIKSDDVCEGGSRCAGSV